MNLFSIENVYLFPELTVGVVKRIFCYKEGILMETDLFPCKFMSDCEYSVIKSDVIKRFDYTRYMTEFVHRKCFFRQMKLCDILKESG